MQQQMKISHKLSSQSSFAKKPLEPPKPQEPLPPSGNLIVSIPRTTAGEVALDHLRENSEKDLGCSFLGTLREILRDYKVENSSYADDLPYIFALLKCADGDEISVINRILRFHCAHGEPEGQHGRVEAAETNASLRLYAHNFGTIGLPFNLHSRTSMHDSYLNLLNVQHAHNHQIEGQGVSIAVIDSGAASGSSFVTQFSDVYDLANTMPTDNVGHGTAMAAIINEIAPKATVVSIRIADLSPSLINTMAGVCKALYDYKVDIINLSLGFSASGLKCKRCNRSAESSSLVFEAFLSSHLQLEPQLSAPLYVTATGNDGKAVFNQPAAYSSALAVGSINNQLQRSSFSNYGPAPGYFLVMPGGDYDQVNNSAVEWAGEGSNEKCLGTSASAAYASGVLALYKSDPNFQGLKRKAFLQNVIGKCQPVPSYDVIEHGQGYLPYL
jgi:hypothetical protein